MAATLWNVLTGRYYNVVLNADRGIAGYLLVKVLEINYMHLKYKRKGNVSSKKRRNTPDHHSLDHHSLTLTLTLTLTHSLTLSQPLCISLSLSLSNI